MYELRKIGILKRASALLLDLILLAVLSTGFIWVVSLICKFDERWKRFTQYDSELKAFPTEYFDDVARYYDEDFVVTEDEEGNYTITKIDGTVASNNDVYTKLINDPSRSEEMEEIYQKFSDLYTQYNIYGKLVSSLLFMMISIGILLSYLVLEFILPIILKNGQTVGKKVFGIAVVRSNCVKISNLSLFARTILGKFAIETMFPVLLVFLFFFGGLGWIAIVLLAALLILNVLLIFLRPNRTPIHDILGNTVAVDMHLQRIYASEEEMNEQVALQHRETVEKSKEEL